MGGGGAGLSDFFLLRIQIYNKNLFFFFGGGGAWESGGGLVEGGLEYVDFFYYESI